MCNLLKSHVIDLINDQDLLVNDLLCLTETQVQLEDNTSNNEEGLRQFYNVSFNSNLNILLTQISNFF